MTNAYPIASEVTPDHPTRRLWEERRVSLLKIGYIAAFHARKARMEG